MSLFMYHKGKVVFPRRAELSNVPVNTQAGAMHHDGKIWVFPSALAYSIFEMAFNPKYRPMITDGETFAIRIDVDSLMIHVVSVKYPKTLTEPPSYREAAIGMIEPHAFEDEPEKPLTRISGWSFNDLERAVIQGADYLNKDFDTTMSALEKLGTFKKSEYAILTVKKFFETLGIEQP